MKQQKWEYPVYEFRPIYEGDYLRYNNGNWIPDDGEYDIAFIEPNKQTTYYVNLPYYKETGWSWVKNGNWGEYVTKHLGGNAWHRTVGRGESWNERDAHPNRIAGEAGMKKLGQMKGCSNGSGPDILYVGDPYLVKRVVRTVDTKEIMEIPKDFNCIYCGKHDLTKEDVRLRDYWKRPIPDTTESSEV